MNDEPTMSAPLLFADEPRPAQTVNPDGGGEVLLTCEHAGRLVPRRIGDLGVAAADMARHIGYDIGAEGVARQLSARLDAPLVVQRYSRLVIDCNRPLAAPDSIPEISDSTPVPGNAGLDAAARRARYDEIHQPWHAEVTRHIAQRAQRAVIAVHSFNPTLGGVRREMHVGLLFNRDARLARALKVQIGRDIGDDLVALNRPYSVDDESDETIPRHGEATGLLHVLLEVRNDLITAEADQLAWGDLLAAAITRALADLA